MWEIVIKVWGNSHKRTNLVSAHFSWGKNKKKKNLICKSTHVIYVYREILLEIPRMHIVMRFKGVRKVFLEISDAAAAYFGPDPYSPPPGCSTCVPSTRWAVFIRLKCFPWSLTKIARHSKHPITSLQCEIILDWNVALNLCWTQGLCSRH